MCQLQRLVRTAIGDDQCRRFTFDQRQQHATRGAAGPEQQHALTADCHAKIKFDISAETRTIGVVTEYLRAVEVQGIHRLGLFRTLAAAGRQTPRFELERQGHIDAAAARRAKCRHTRGKTVERCEQAHVFKISAALASEGGMDLRREAVGNGIANDGVTVSHRGVL